MQKYIYKILLLISGILLFIASCDSCGIKEKPKQTNQDNNKKPPLNQDNNKKPPLTLEERVQKWLQAWDKKSEVLLQEVIKSSNELSQQVSQQAIKDLYLDENKDDSFKGRDKRFKNGDLAAKKQIVEELKSEIGSYSNYIAREGEKATEGDKKDLEVRKLQHAYYEKVISLLEGKEDPFSGRLPRGTFVYDLDYDLEEPV